MRSVVGPVVGPVAVAVAVEVEMPVAEAAAVATTVMCGIRQGTCLINQTPAGHLSLDFAGIWQIPIPLVSGVSAFVDLSNHR